MRGRYIQPSDTASTAWDATEAAFVVSCEIRSNTDLVEPIFCLEEEGVVDRVLEEGMRMAG